MSSSRDLPTSASDPVAEPRASTESSPVSQQVLDNMPSKPPCFDFLGAEVVEFSPGRVRLRYRPEASMENPFGVIQGGILVGMLDNALGPAVMTLTGPRPMATVQMSVNYLRPVKTGDVVIVDAEVIKHGRIQAYVEARILRESDNALMVRANATHAFLAAAP